MKTVLTIAGSDCSGGAGIQADIKTIAAHGLYAMSAVTALTAQNTTGVYGILEVPPEFLEKQLACIFEDIVPDAVKIGMTASSELIHVISASLRKYKARHVVVDPVMVSTSGSVLLKEEARKALTTELFPLAEVITPNIPETEKLGGIAITAPEDMEEAARRIAVQSGAAVLVKGGHETNSANDLLYDNGQIRWFYGEHIVNPNTHGTGCTLSSAIAAGLAAGRTLQESVEQAKAYISGALRQQMDLGKGSGPLDHMYGCRGWGGEGHHSTVKG